MTVDNNIAAERFSAQVLSEHVRILASDEFEGRLPGSAGELKTIAYLTKRFERFGLQRGGVAGSWTQEVPLRRIELIDVQTCRAAVGETSVELRHRDSVVLTSLSCDAEVVIHDAPIVFTGYGIYAPELHWDDFKGVDIRGKVAVVLINAPDFGSPTHGRFGDKAMTYYGRWNYKFEEAGRRGAAGVLVVHEAGPAGYSWETVVNSLGASQYDLDSADSVNAHPSLRGWLRRDMAEKLLRHAGLELDALKACAANPDFQPLTLPQSHLALRAKLRSTSVVSHNVIAKVAGRERPQESVIYGAHWDHLGVAKRADGADAVFHGAVDNATAIAGILELARTVAAASPPARSIYFAAFTAEEKGLLGSKYYVMHPPADLELTAAVFTMEFLGATGPARDLSTWGNVRNDLWESISRAAARRRRVLSVDRYLETGLFFRSDHFPFAQRGVPALTVTSGQDLYAGGEVAGRKAYSDYLAQRYHQPADCWSSDLDLTGLSGDLDILYEAGLEIANSASWPQWHEETTYKHVRSKSHVRRSSNINNAVDPDELSRTKKTL